jgi:hypothetical protein
MKGILHKVNGSWMVKDSTGEIPFPLFPLHPYEHQHDGLDDGSEVEYEVVTFYETGIEPYMVAMLSTPFVSDNFQIGPEGAYEYGEELDDFQFHEVMDRLTIINEMIENCLISHPVCENHLKLKDIIESAQDLLGDAYLEVDRIRR